MSSLVKPTVIYLQNKDSDHIDDSWMPRDEMDVTWCKDEINKHDSVYVRADMIPEDILQKLGISKERAEL